MFSKLLSFILIYILSVINFLVVLSPLTFLMVGKYFLATTSQGRYVESLIFLSISATSGLMLLLLFLDFCFASSVCHYARHSIPADSKKEYASLAEAFEEIKSKFNRADVTLHIANVDEINAYAVGSLRKNIVVATTGLLNMYRANSTDEKEYLTHLKCILGHEMSHIINKDYFTALLLRINEKANRFVSKIIWLFFMFLIRLLSLIPLVGEYVAIIIDSLYNALDFLIGFFYKYVMLTLYKFIQLQISKNIEYRADRQGALAAGGNFMADTLAMLGDSGYFTIFSTHPSTRRRVEKVKNIPPKNDALRPVFGVNITFLLSFLILIGSCYGSLKLAGLEELIRDCQNIALFFKNKYVILKTKVLLLVSRLKSILNGI